MDWLTYLKGFPPRPDSVKGIELSFEKSVVVGFKYLFLSISILLPGSLKTKHSRFYQIWKMSYCKLYRS